MAFSLGNIFSSFKEKASAGGRKTVGIDIGASSIKVVEIEETEKALVLRTYGELQLGPYGNAALGDITKLEKEKRIEALVDVIREAGVTAERGVLIIPLSASFMTVVPLPNVTDEDIDSKLRVEARKYIPLPLSDIALDWTELPQPENAPTSTKEVLIAAIEHATIAEYKETLKAIQMASQPSEIEAFSLVRALSRVDDTTLAVLDLGARTSKLYIANNGMIERVHRIATGGAAITKRLSEMQDISFEEAENRKRAYKKGGEHARDIEKATMSLLDSVGKEFKRIIDQYEVRTNAEIARTTISGGVASFPGTIPYFQDVFSRSVEVGNPFDKVAYPAFMEDTLTTIAPTFGVSMGAALRFFSEG